MERTYVWNETTNNDVYGKTETFYPPTSVLSTSLHKKYLATNR